MKEKQTDRYEKLFNEEFYLLDKKKIDKKLLFSISGSTKNVYIVTIYLKDEMADTFCTCPDKKSHAKRNKCLCKHELFTFIKVLGVQSTDLMFDTEEMPILQGPTLLSVIDNFEKLNVETDKNFNKNLAGKLKNGTVTDINNLIKTKLESTEMCGVCFDDFGEISPDLVHICTECHNIAHNKCYNKWIEMGNKMCVYCRRTETKTKNTGNYQNLA